MESSDAIAALNALGQETRLAIFRLLVSHEPDGLAAGEIAVALDVLPNTLSANLAILARAGLVTSEREGRSIRYRSALSGMNALIDFLTRDCCDGQPDLCGLQPQPKGTSRC